MAGVPTHDDWKEIDEEVLESDGGEKQEQSSPKTPKPEYDYAESQEETVLTDGGVTTDTPSEFYQPRLQQRKSALDGDTVFSDSSDELLPEDAELERHSRASDLVRSQIDSYKVDGRYVTGVTVEDVAEADSLTKEEAEQLLENDIEQQYDGTFDYRLETEETTLYVNDTTVDGSKQRQEIENGEIWA